MSSQRDFCFNVKVKKGTHEHEHGQINLLVVEDTVPFWGELISCEFNVTRDDKPARDVAVYSLGVNRRADGSLNMKIQLLDYCVQTIVEHEYSVNAHCLIKLDDH